MHDAAICVQWNRLSITEPTENAIIWNEKHFFDFMKKLEAHDIDLAGVWCRLYKEAEFVASSLAQSDSVWSHSHALGT